MARALLSPRMLALHALVLVAVVGAFLLGVWQIGAWQENREDKASELVSAPAVPLDKALGRDEPFPSVSVGQPVTLVGQWLGDETFYVADKSVDDRSGYWVVTPVATEGGSAILVVRGWSTESAAPPVQGPANVTGWLQPGEAAAGVDEDPGDDVLPSLRIADALERLDQDLYGGYVIAEEPVAPGLTPVTPDQLPEPDAFTSLRNLLYGLEWWVFGAFAVFLWWRWCRDEVERVRSGTAAAADDLSDDEPEVPSTP